MWVWETKELCVRVYKMVVWALEMSEMKREWGVGGGRGSCKYTPLYKKGIKENQNKPVETTKKQSKC